MFGTNIQMTEDDIQFTAYFPLKPYTGHENPDLYMISALVYISLSAQSNANNAMHVIGRYIYIYR